MIDTRSSIALFQRWEWGEVQKLSGVTVFRFGYYEKSKLVGIALACLVKAKRGNFLHVRHGPVLTQWNARVFKTVISHLKTIAKENACVCIRISPCIENSGKNEAIFKNVGGIPAAIHAMDAEHSWILDLALSEEQLLTNMRKTTRYEIRRAQKLGVSVEKTKDPESLSLFFDLYNRTAKRHGFVEHQNIKEEFGVFAAVGKAIHIIGRINGKPLASAIILLAGNEAIYHHGASELSSVPASYLVQWEAIREAKRLAMAQYNFWGIAPTDDTRHPWQGLTQFKKGFGGTTRSMVHAYDFPLSWRYWPFRIVEWMRKQYKGY